MKIILLLAVGALWATSTDAHHSRAAYNTDVVTVVEGKLVGVRWRNPHIVFELSVANEDGSQHLWRMEAGSIYMLKRAGLSQDLFKSGSTVQIAGHLSIHEDRDFLANSILFSDGKEVLTMPNVEPYWSDARLGGRDQWLSDNERLEDAATGDRGIFTVWSIPKGRSRTSDLPLKASAIAARKDWDMVDNVLTRCQQPGMPRIMVNPHPYEFIDNGSHIVMLGEEFDMVRTIYLAEHVPPEKPAPSNLGFSVARWENNTLVIRTTGINWPYFDGIGTPQSEDIEMVEHYTLSEDQLRLDYQFTISDPSILDAPATYTGYWLALGEKVEPFKCEVY